MTVSVHRTMLPAVVATLLLAAASPALAESKQVACTTVAGDPLVTFDDAIDIELHDHALHSLRWIARQTIRDTTERSHAFECELSIDLQRFDVRRTSQGSVAIDRDDPSCRIDVLVADGGLILLPHCRSGCQTSGRYRALALDVDRGTCRPVDERFVKKVKP